MIKLHLNLPQFSSHPKLNQTGQYKVLTFPGSHRVLGKINGQWREIGFFPK